MINTYQKILKALSEAPPTQIDPQAAARLALLSYQPSITSDQFLAIIDDLVYGSGASDFAISAMDAVWKTMCDEEGVTYRHALNNRNPALRHHA